MSKPNLLYVKIQGTQYFNDYSSNTITKFTNGLNTINSKPFLGYPTGSVKLVAIQVAHQCVGTTDINITFDTRVSHTVSVGMLSGMKFHTCVIHNSLDFNRLILGLPQKKQGIINRVLDFLGLG